MRIIFNPNEERTFSRSKTLSNKPLVVADGVNPTDDVELEFTDDCILVKKTGKDEEINSETEWLYIGKSLGLYGLNKDLKSVVEYILCDEYIAVKLIKGAITVHPDANSPEDVILVATGVDESTLPAPYLNNIKWIDRDYLASLCKYWGDFADKYPADYLYQSIVAGDGGACCNLSISKLSMLDISYGALALKKEKALEMERKKKLKEVSNMFTSAPEGIQFETFDTDSNDDEDGDDDDDFYNY